MANDYALAREARRAAENKSIAPEMAWMQGRTLQDAANIAHDTAEKQNAKWKSE